MELKRSAMYPSGTAEMRRPTENNETAIPMDSFDPPIKKQEVKEIEMDNGGWTYRVCKCTA